MVRLWALRMIFAIAWIVNFNSTMVRLWVWTVLGAVRQKGISIPLWFDYGAEYVHECQSNWFRFQFHYGSIMGGIVMGLFPWRLLFQFHYGSIMGLFFVSFIFSVLIFQFHYGSIMGWYDTFNNRHISSFQFHYGSIMGKGYFRWTGV